MSDEEQRTGEDAIKANLSVGLGLQTRQSSAFYAAPALLARPTNGNTKKKKLYVDIGQCTSAVICLVAPIKIQNLTDRVSRCRATLTMSELLAHVPPCRASFCLSVK